MRYLAFIRMDWKFISLLLVTLMVMAGFLLIIQSQKNEIHALKLSGAIYDYEYLDGKIGGLYQGGIFCIDARKRTWSDVMETCSHEYLHYTRPGHFTEP